MLVVSFLIEEEEGDEDFQGRSLVRRSHGDGEGSQRKTQSESARVLEA